MSGIKTVASIHLDNSRLDQLDAQLNARAEAILDRAAFNIQGCAIRNTVRVDTGAMRNGWRVEHSGAMERTIFNTQEYAIYNELGTRYMSATPMLYPAVEAERGYLVESWARLFD
jgi:hypothetical protein